jgi:hypothetical protein
MMARPATTRAAALFLIGVALAAPTAALAQRDCQGETRCPEGQTWDHATGTCTAPLSS